MSKPLTKSIHCFLDSARGVYIPRDFARTIRRDCIEGVEPSDLDYLARGPGGCDDEDLPLAEGETVRGEFYDDTWQTVLDNAVLTDPDSGNKFKLHQGESGDLFLVPEDWEWCEESQSFRPPESDTLLRFELPAYWASYLINGDGSGLEPGEEKTISDFLEREGLAGFTCADCSQEAHFSRWNAAGTPLAGDVLEYTFVKIGGAE